MDPFTIIGSVGALCNIIEVLSKTITSIYTFQARMKDGDLIFLGLASQLVALRAALSKIQDWMDGEADEAHHQLTMDLGYAISACKLLVNKLGTFFSQLDRPTNRPLDVVGKFKVAFGVGGVEELQKLLERQLSALNLLLTACNCKALSDQKQLLERPKARKTLQRAKADSISMVVLCDTESFTTKWTDNLSKISHVFDFDSVVFSTLVYSRVFRSSLKDTLRRRQEWTTTKRAVGPFKSASTNAVGLLPSEKNLAVQEPWKRHLGSRVVLLMGDDQAGRDVVTARLQVGHQLRQHESVAMPGRTARHRSFYANNFEYVVHEVDIQDDAWTENADPAHETFIVFAVDLCGYHQRMPALSLTRMAMSLHRFRYLANLEVYEKSPILLFFRNLDQFTEALRTFPLEQYFENYDGGADVEEALEFIREFFLSNSPMRGLSRVACLVASDDCSNLEALNTFLDASLPMERERIEAALPQSGTISMIDRLVTGGTDTPTYLTTLDSPPSPAEDPHSPHTDRSRLVDTNSVPTH